MRVFLKALAFTGIWLALLIPTERVEAKISRLLDIECGDANSSGNVDLTDVNFTINYLFSGGPAPDPYELGDQDCSGAIDIADCVYLISYLYELGGPAPCCPSKAHYCPRATTTGFDLVTAEQMAKLANHAYKAGPTLSSADIITSCWEGIRFLQSDPNFECDVPQIPSFEDTQLFLARDPWTGDLVVSFRGSGTLEDWISNAQFADAVDWNFDDGTSVSNAVHKGFLCAYQSVEAELKNDLESAIDDLDDVSDVRVYFTGHSLGGALATIAALDLVDWLVDAKDFQRDHIVMYSVAAPRAFKPSLQDDFASKVPNSCAIMEKTDPVPYLLPTYEHVWRVAIINSRVSGSGAITATRLEFAGGEDISDCGPVTQLVPWSYEALEGHDREKYITRLEEVESPGLPTVSISVSNGRMRLAWSGVVQGPCDRVILCDGCPSEIDFFNPLANDWEWVVKASSKQTPQVKSEGLRAAYVDGFGRVINVSSPYVAKTPSKLTLTRRPLGFLEVTWKVSDEGLYDYVALYKQNPNTAGPTGYVAGSKHLVYSDTDDTWSSVHPGGPFWVAYVTADALVGGQRRILAVKGPVN